MGYYIDFVFDASTTRDDVLARIREAEAVLVPAELTNKPIDEFWWSLQAGAPPPWIAPAQGMLVRVYEEETTPAGNWADTRLSWGTSQDEWASAMDVIFNFADRMSCRVWDGQIKRFVAPDTWESLILERFFREAHSIFGLVGTAQGASDNTTVRDDGPRPRGTAEEEWDWNARTEKCLQLAGISNLNQLTLMTAVELRTIRNLGERGLREIRAQLARYGLTLKDEG